MANFEYGYGKKNMSDIRDEFLTVQVSISSVRYSKPLKQNFEIILKFVNLLSHFRPSCKGYVWGEQYDGLSWKGKIPLLYSQSTTLALCLMQSHREFHPLLDQHLFR